MKKIAFLLTGIIIGFVLVSCSVQYEMSGLKKLEFKHPAQWQIIDTKDDYTYDYVFGLKGQQSEFEVYLRTSYAPLTSSMQWLKQQKKEAKAKGYKSSKVTRFSTKDFKWHLMEKEELAQRDGKNVPIDIRYYITKENKSPRMIQCFVVGQKDSFKNLPEAQINKFLDSMSFKALKIPSKDEYSYKNYVSSAAEAIFLKRGEKLLGQGEFSRAIIIFESLLKRPITDKLQVKLNFMLSLCFFEKGINAYVETKDMRDFKLAIQFAKQAINVDKEYWQAYFNIGIIYLNIGEAAKAKKYLKQAISYCPKEAPEYSIAGFYFDEAKAPLRYKRSISKMFSKQNRITGFVYSQTDPMVIISDKLYRAKDKIAKYTILKITKDKAFMRLGLRVDEFVSGDLIVNPQLIKESE